MDGGESNSIWMRLARVFGANENEDTLTKTIIEASAEGEVEPEEEHMLLGVLRFRDLLVRDTMTPRLDICCIKEDADLTEAVRTIVESGHSRIPVFRDTHDNMVGMLHAKDVLRHILEKQNAPIKAGAIMRETFFVPETKPIRILLQEFRSLKQHIAIALDEYGGTSGLITIEDVLEEIVGDIEDEHDTPREEDIHALGDNKYELTGRAFLEEVSEVTGASLLSDEVDTIGGYLSMHAGHVPEVGEEFEINGWHFKVLDSTRKTIRKLQMQPVQQKDSETT